ncbi:MAG: hypothetical protein COA45_00210 [Zetaproteobacteria bacterium]|nr:MAG: hypothetical protein COA45_00210 [Zetaproteobacteria bacterium]
MGDITGLSSLRDELTYIDVCLDKILDGEKLYLDPERDKDKRIIDIIHSFYPDDFDQALERSLDTRPEMYYITPQQIKDGEEKILLEANTRVHPLHENLHLANEGLCGRASKIQVRNFTVAGANLHFRDRRDYEGLFERSPNILLHAKGDVVSLSQIVKLLRGIAEGNDRSERSIIIDNSTGRFDPFLKMVDLDTQDGVNALNTAFDKNTRNASIIVVDEPRTVIGRLAQVGLDTGKTLPKLPQLIHEKAFQATSSDEKIKDIRMALRAHRSNLQTITSDSLGGLSEHDPEFQWTFAGNNFAKALTTTEDKKENPHVLDVLEKMSIPYEEAGLIYYDGGECNAERGLRDTSTLAPYKSTTHPYAEYPAAETKPWSQSIGTNEDTYVLCDKAFKEIKETQGREADRRLLDNCVVLYMPLHQEDMKNPRYYAYKATTMLRSSIDLDPLLSVNHGHKTQRHFHKPMDREETLAQMEDANDPWMVEKLAISKAITGFSDAVRMPRNKIDLKADFDKVKDLVVHCPVPLSSAHEGQYRKDLEKNGLKFGTIDKPVRSFDDVRRTIYNAKAIFVPQDSGEKDVNFWTDLIFLPASTIVEKQLSNPNVNGMPVVFHSDTSERTDFEVICDHLKRSNMVAQDLQHLFYSSDDIDKASEYIKQQILDQHVYEDYAKFDNVSLPETDRSSIVFLESATSASPVDNNNAYNLAINCGLNGFDNMSGWGMAGPMGAVVWAGLQLRREGFDVDVMGVQDPNAMKTEGAPFEAMEHLMGKEYGIVSQDIYIRIWRLLEMERLQKDPSMKKIAVAQGCGIGGLQEMAAVFALKELKVPGADRLHLIIENSPRDLPTGEIAPHDALLSLLEKRGELNDENGVYATTCPRETLEIIGEIEQKEMIYFDAERPEGEYTIFPFERSKNILLPWLMGKVGEDGLCEPEKSIRQLYNETLENRDRTMGCEPE